MRNFSDPIWLTSIPEHALFWPITRAICILLLAWILRGPLANLLALAISWLAHILLQTDRLKLGKVLNKPLRGMVLVIALYLAIDQLPFQPKTEAIILRICQSLLAISVFYIVFAVLRESKEWFGRSLEGRLTRPMIAWLVKILQGLLIFMGLAVVLDLWGIQIGPILAGLGLVGAAVALGAQDLFKNLIAGMMIITERRFDIGDWIIVNDRVDGDVEKIGLRSTLIRRYDKSPLYVPNTQLADGALINMSRMRYRRIQMTIGLKYQTASAQLKQIRNDIKSYINESPDFLNYDESASFVGLDSFGEYSLNFLVQCYTVETRWQPYMRIRAQLASKIQEAIEAAGTEFAVPSQTIHIEGGERRDMPAT